MASGKNVGAPQIDPEIERCWQLARRDDLATVYRVAVSIPRHGQDEFGNWRYGVSPIGGMVLPETIAEFEDEMRSIIVESTSPLVKAGILTEQQVEAIKGHNYEVGPAAQSWPQFFFEVYQQAEPFISGGADLIAVADFLKQVVNGIRNWQYRKRQDVEQTLGANFNESIALDLDLGLVLTLPDLVALCYADLIDRYGKGGDIVIETYPRSNFHTYATAGHPAGSETYLIRFKAGAFSFYYLIDGHGGVWEHYLMAGDDITLLPLPVLLSDESNRGINRQPNQSRRFEVRSINSPAR